MRVRKKYLTKWYMIPQKKRSSRRPRFVRRKRFARKVQRTTNVNRSLQPIPSRYICKLKYADSLLTNASGQTVVNLNSLFDPDRTGIGHQPYAYDNLALLYNRYRVISCGWRANVCLGATSPPIVIASMPSNDASILWGSMGEMLENPRSKYITQNPGAPSVYLTGKSYLPALMGRTKAQYMADDNYQAIVTTSPNELGLLYLQVFDNTGTPLPSIRINVVLEFTAEFFDIKRVIQS